MASDTDSEIDNQGSYESNAFDRREGAVFDNSLKEYFYRQSEVRSVLKEMNMSGPSPERGVKKSSSRMDALEA